MSELRWHPFLEQWVITATHRQERTFLPPKGYCPLCPSKPGGFPTEIPAEDFDIVVFENRFPSLQASPPPPVVAGTDLWPVTPASGVCEVVVYSPEHQGALGSMPPSRVRNVVRVWRDRYMELGSIPGVKYVLVFENRGEAVGVTLHHPHGQIYAFPFVPPVAERELSAFRAHRRRTGRCLLCDTLREERADGRRLVLEGQRFVVWVPFHARYPYEAWIAPVAHQASMAEWTAADEEDLAAVLRGLASRYDALFGKPFPYVMVVHQAPTGGGEPEGHLHLEFYPPLRTESRLKFLAGCELGAGTFINDTLAEETAAELRRAAPPSPAAPRGSGRPSASSLGTGGAGGAPMSELLAAAFGPGGEAVTAVAPGRVNLIGEHTDYNQGFVLPMAIEAGVEVAGRRRPDDLVRIHSASHAETVAFSLAEPIRRDPDHPWSDYLRGVLQVLREAGWALSGMDLAVGGTLPQGAGLSSSAALEVATALVAADLHGAEAEPARLALLCQKAENEFVGVQCGVMDPFVSLAARAGHALFLDCRSLRHEHVPLELSGYAVAVCHSGVRHALVGSEYNLRRRQCQAGVEALRASFPGISALRDATPEQLEACRGRMSPEVHRRCRHVVAENQRVLDSVAALRAGDLPLFGRLLDASHASLRDDYQVSCPEIDLLVELARSQPGVLGSRLTGGGFGGCTVNLVSRDALEPFRDRVLEEYRLRTGLSPRLFLTVAAAGARVSR
ncbi:MAG TPA: galactokinase [Anaeromyxobacteraceae bacterium]|nr:galactokinase [Anaeromyxobacteraceae bacterium]